MNVGQLMVRLARFAPESEVWLMTKEGTVTLESGLHGVCGSDDLTEHDPLDGRVIVYLVQGATVGLGHADAWGVCD